MCCFQVHVGYILGVKATYWGYRLRIKHPATALSRQQLQYYPMYHVTHYNDTTETILFTYRLTDIITKCSQSRTNSKQSATNQQYLLYKLITFEYFHALSYIVTKRAE
jgi:hypothetical protein